MKGKLESLCEMKRASMEGIHSQNFLRSEKIHVSVINSWLQVSESNSGKLKQKEKISVDS